MENPMSAKEIGKRLRLLRLAKGFEKQPPMAQLLGVSNNRYNNWEVGVVAIPITFANILCAKTGATTDYIYRGDVSGLPVRLASALQEISSKEGLAAGSA